MTKFICNDCKDEDGGEPCEYRVREKDCDRLYMDEIMKHEELYSMWLAGECYDD